MKIADFTFAAATFAVLATGTVTARTAAHATVLPRGTVVHLVTMAPLSTAGNKSGDEFYLEVADDVSLNGVVVIPRGSPAAGHVYARSRDMLAARIVAVRVNGTDVPLHGLVKFGVDDLPTGSATAGATDRDLPFSSAL